MVVAFILTLAVSFVIVRIGAIAFQLTGLEWSLAKFQSLSCFTGTGFTTKEAELITGNPQRRKVASILMVLGNAGLVLLVATFASSIITQGTLISLLSRSFLNLPIPEVLVKFINITILIAAVVVLYKVFTNKSNTLKLTNFLRAKMIKKSFFRQVSFEELLVETGGFGVSRVKILSNSPVVDKRLIDTDLREHGINLMAIVREGETIATPHADTAILRGDELICFGKLGEIREYLVPEEAKKVKAEE